MGLGSPVPPPLPILFFFLEAAQEWREGGKSSSSFTALLWEEQMATGGWQGLVIGRQVKDWEGAERTEVAPGKWEKLEGPRWAFSRGGMEKKGGNGAKEGDQAGKKRK